MSKPESNTLFDIVREYQDQLSSLQDADLPAEVVLDTIEAMQGDVESKLRAVVAYALQIKADAETRKAHAKRMADSAKAMESRYDSLMMYAQIGVMNSGLKLPVNLPEFTLNLAKNPPSLDDAINSVTVPSEYKRRSCTFDIPANWTEEDTQANLQTLGVVGAIEIDCALDKRKLLDAVKADPEACKDFARLNPTSYRLTVR